ncbi:DNA-binding protein [Salmonella enterica]|nr:DNA-binding protein [Salmonella enterica]EJA5049853.1 DNA-binding protein [Salmonella enterica]EJA5146992.1 DNA-binding protein [Salmonella enterica]EJA5818775.1 DNA-binding protein [Salmonella enterica]EJA5855491.1 DNA-binding protein [Salmonella enterica]
MIKIEIKPSQVTFEERKGKTDKGREWISREQKGYIYLGGDYPELFVIPLANGQPPYEAGFYELTEQCFAVGSFHKLTTSKAFVLRPIQNNKA